jgi:hypothetical protein
VNGVVACANELQEFQISLQSPELLQHLKNQPMKEFQVFLTVTKKMKQTSSVQVQAMKLMIDSMKTPRLLSRPSKVQFLL